ncbi:MAG: hypothetical protein Rubg2KO_21690 [Rubricoccaceae bacterium]
MPSLLTKLIDDSAARTPEQEAVRFNGAALTYAELSRQSDQLATLLIDQGVQKGDRVALLLGKGLQAAVSIYGVMKAGAAYVPLDVTAPPSRLAFILRDCGIRHLVTAPAHVGALKEILAEGTPVEVCVGIEDTDELAVRCLPWRAVEEALNGAPDVHLAGSDLAYILYTSGSTGTPKGVMHTHASGLSWAQGTASAYGLAAEDRLSNHAPLHFDLSTFDYFASALVGATTVIIPEIYTKLPASLSALIPSERLSVVYAVPFAFTQLLLHGALDKRDLSTLRWVLFAGEPFPARYLRALMQRVPHARFANIYGPTEVNGVTHYIVPDTFAHSDEDTVPIGDVFPFASAMVVDEDDQHVEPGEPGELWIRSDTAMQGYWGRPDLNATAFVEPSGERFYRTGDLVRQRDDRVLLFLGRKDRQVKTRGHRVELAEVEAVLADHEAISEVAAFTVPDTEGSHRILAAISAQPGIELTVSTLREYAFTRLPAYAVPERIAVLDVFPRTPTGKVDRITTAALAARQLADTESE